jgi:hypothetical protein
LLAFGNDLPGWIALIVDGAFRGGGLRKIKNGDVMYGTWNDLHANVMRV